MKKYEVYKENIINPDVSDLIGVFEAETQDEIRQSMGDPEGLTVIEIIDQNSTK